MTEALYILSLCRQFKCLPSQLFAEGALLGQLLTIEALGLGGDVE